MSSQQGYDHVQRGRIHWLVYAVAAVSLWAGLVILNGTANHGPVSTAGIWVFFVIGAVMAVLGMCFQYMRVRDLGDVLEINFGPLPWLRKEVRYEDIHSVEQGRTAWIDGWGVHTFPGRGWTWNVWGRDCAELTVNGSTLRVGTDDPEGLVSFIEERIGSRD